MQAGAIKKGQNVVVLDDLIGIVSFLCHVITTPRFI